MAEERDETKEPVKAPRTANARKSAPAKETVKDETPAKAAEPVEEPKASKSTTKREQIISEGETFEVEMVTREDGVEVVKESVYRTVNLPNSKRTTQRLVKAAGTKIY